MDVDMSCRHDGVSRTRVQREPLPPVDALPEDTVKETCPRVKRRQCQLPRKRQLCRHLLILLGAVCK